MSPQDQCEGRYTSNAGQNLTLQNVVSAVACEKRRLLKPQIPESDPDRRAAYVPIGIGLGATLSAGWGQSRDYLSV